MSDDAEMRKAEVGAVQSITGQFCRWRTIRGSLRSDDGFAEEQASNELPQCGDTSLMGDMSAWVVSLVLFRFNEVEKFEDTAQRRRLSVKPVLTCLWQISRFPGTT